MTRIDHTGHNHPNTTAARQACRKEILAAHAAIDGHYAAFPVALGPDPRDPIVVRVAQREQELDDAFETPTVTFLNNRTSGVPAGSIGTVVRVTDGYVFVNNITRPNGTLVYTPRPIRVRTTSIKEN